jgi:hypothetical protein
MDVIDDDGSHDGPKTENREPKPNSGASSIETEADLREGSIGIIRELVLKANPDLVAEMVRGESLTELMASVEPARAAYQRIAESVRSEARTAAPVVPAGGTGGAVAIEDLTADGLIKRALARRR